jgi:phosphoribosylaminoimidazole-succinocarboxamide synthase
MVLKTVELPFLGKKTQGKVRDIYHKNAEKILITTDRISAFDRVLGFIPQKGQVLNQLSQFWFEKTKDIVPNHLIDVPDPNVTIAKNCQSIAIEAVIRGYISGVTTTSLWYNYNLGKRYLYGKKFPDNLKKNQKLPQPILTPTTRATGKAGHDEIIDRQKIIQQKIIGEKLYDLIEKTAISLFERGTQICDKAGLILVDTKYEFGLHNGQLTLIDEIHTPDSSRFWIKDTYAQRIAKGLEPENFDKEFFRLWFVKKGYRGEGKSPKLTVSFASEVSQRYIKTYELLTGKKFLTENKDITKRIEQNLKRYYADVVVISGSDKDKDHVKKIEDKLKELGLSTASYIASAHKQPKQVLETLEFFKNRKVVFITVAGRSNALSGFVAANCNNPVIACPPFIDKHDYLINIHSTLQMPSNVPVLTVIDPGNAALAAQRIHG